MADPPLVSIITPCRNARSALAETLASVAEAAARAPVPVEHIVIDGGSDDGTADLLAEDPRIARWLSAPDDGPYDAVAKGLDLARGEILAWLNAGDVYLPQTLATVAGIFADLADVQWLSARATLAMTPGGSLLGGGRLPGFARRAFLDGVYVSPAAGNPLAVEFIQQESTFWRRSLWQAADGAGVIRRWPLAGDFALWAAFYRHTPLIGVDGPLGVFRMDRTQRSQTHFRTYLAECDQILTELRTAFDHTPPPAQGLQWYRGLEAFKADPRDPDAPWQVGESPFAIIGAGDIKDLLRRHRLG